MIINFKVNRIVSLFIVLTIFAIYSWLVVWTTKAVMQQMEKRALSQEAYDHDKHASKQTKQKQQRRASEQSVVEPKKILKLGISNRTSTDTEEQLAKCEKHLSASQKRWFRARFNPEVETTWTEENLDLDYQVYDWWLTLQSSGGIDTEKSLKGLFDIGVPRENPYKRSEADMADKCRKCAVIGNSGNLHQANYGEIIDSHDLVIRMNKAPTQGFEKDVGSKTTHRFMYPESAIQNLPPGVSFVLTPFKPMDVKWLHSALTTGEIKNTYAPVPSKITCDTSNVIIINPAFIKYVHDRWTQHHGRYPSTGLLAVVYALHECDEVNLFGFGADAQGNWHHYWETLPANVAGAFKSTGVHDPEWEKTILDQLQKQEIIHIYLPK